MTPFIKTRIADHTAFIMLDRLRTFNSLSLEMVRALSAALRAWRNDSAIGAVVIHSSTPKAFCAGGDIRFFYEVGTKLPTGGSALLEDFFTEEYALNHLIHYYPKPYIALMDGVIMGGGMGITQAGPQRLRIVTDRTKMAMPEVNIGLFPDVGGSHFLSRTPGQLGRYLALSGENITAHDALYAGLADVYIPSAALPALLTQLESTDDARAAVLAYAQHYQAEIAIDDCHLARNRAAIDRHFSLPDVGAILASLAADPSPFAQQTLAVMQTRSPLMLCVTLEQLRRGQNMTLADCLRMERTMVRRNFEHGEMIEGLRASIISRDRTPQWSPPTLAEVTPEMVAHFFESAWPDYAHPLRDLD